MTDLERAIEAIHRAGHRYGLSVPAVRILAQAALDGMEEQRKETAAAVPGQAQGLGKEHVQQPLAGMAPIAPTRTNPLNPLRFEPGPGELTMEPLYQETWRQSLEKLRRAQDEEGRKPLPQDHRPGRDQQAQEGAQAGLKWAQDQRAAGTWVAQPKPEHWEVCHMAFPVSHPGWLTQVTPGWEPFAVHNGVLWLKRRVP